LIPGRIRVAATSATHRVVCTDFAHETNDLAAAQRYLAGVEAGGHCREPHTIEVRVVDAWVSLHIVQARGIAAGLLTRHTEGPAKGT
jgi:hypothetical protein